MGGSAKKARKISPPSIRSMDLMVIVPFQIVL